MAPQEEGLVIGAGGSDPVGTQLTSAHGDDPGPAPPTDFYSLSLGGRTRRLRRLAEAALAGYDLDVERITPMSTETNAVFRVDAGERYVLRIGRGGAISHPLEQVRAEVEFLATIGSEGLRVPQPVPTRSGDLIVQESAAGVPETRNVVVFRYLEGRLLGDRLHRSSLEAYGRLAGELHAAAESYVPDHQPQLRYDRTFPFDEPIVVLDAGRSAYTSPAQRDLFVRAAERVDEASRQLAANTGPIVIHGDLHRWNVLIGAGGAAAFDFEDLMWGWPVQDLAVGLYYLYDEPKFESRLDWFRSGYEQIRAWPDPTGELLPLFIAGRALVLANSLELLEEPEYQQRAPELITRIAKRVATLLA